MAKKRTMKRRAKRKGPGMHAVVREIKKVMAKTKGKKELAGKHRQLKQLLTRAKDSCDGNGFFLA
jgi:hypothetical protein